LQSKSGQPLERYFPELVAAVQALTAERFAIDGEIVVPVNGGLSFDELLLRIHPAESRIRKLAAERPAMLIVFDILVDPAGRLLVDHALSERRESLELYVKRLQKLETIADSFDGVSKSYAIQAGRELRIAVKPESIDDAGSADLARLVARRVESEVEYPGQIKVTVIREVRATETAR
jgi:ATP-dependent DNA ligase